MRRVSCKFTGLINFERNMIEFQKYNIISYKTKCFLPFVGMKIGKDKLVSHFISFLCLFYI